MKAPKASMKSKGMMGGGGMSSKSGKGMSKGAPKSPKMDGMGMMSKKARNRYLK
jgi:hypothetical protein